MGLPDALNVLFIHGTEAEGLILTRRSILYSCYDEQEIRTGSVVREVLDVRDSGRGKESLGSRLGFCLISTGATLISETVTVCLLLPKYWR